MQLFEANQIRTMVLVMVLAVLVGPSLCLPSQSDSNEMGHKTETEPTLLDFEHYQKIYQKNYAEPVERTVRKIYFLASAFMVYTKAVAYKFWKSSSYYALNHMSDWSPEELERMQNKVMANELRGQQPIDEDEQQLHDHNDEEIELDFSSKSPEIVAKELEEKIRRELKEANLEQTLELDGNSPELKRAKRDTAALQHRASRQLSMAKLIKDPNQTGPISPKTDRRPKSNNPKYNPLALEATTMGLKDQVQPVVFYKFKADRSRAPVVSQEGWQFSAFESLKSVLSPLASLVIGDQNANPAEPDEMFEDLRTSGCLSPVRDQGHCGSCYAFAGIALAEYLYCSRTDSLISFSEQYLIDCGKGRIEGMNGCDGGNAKNLPEFVSNFGLELRDHYPYLDSESECVYADDLDLNKTGFIRMPLRKSLMVPMWHWPEQLKVSPLYIVMALPRGCQRYGGGIESGRWCARDDNYHAMLLVGHGRENGQEFWLIRNSYGPDWGEAGYFKLAKSAPERCIEHQVGWAYGTSNGLHFDVQPRLNELNRRPQLVDEVGKRAGS